MALSFINVFLGFLLANIAYAVTRSKQSRNSPVKWDWVFWWRDNGLKIVVSLLFSLCLNLIIQLNLEHASEILQNNYRPWHPLLFGAFPDAALSVFHNLTGFLKPSSTSDSLGNTYNRK